MHTISVHCLAKFGSIPTVILQSDSSMVKSFGPRRGLPRMIFKRCPYMPLQPSPSLTEAVYLKPEIKQVWYADDASASGSLSSLHYWWDKLRSSDPVFGCHANQSKTCLMTKDKCLHRARETAAPLRVSLI